ncbi:MAG: hypothetical protein M0P69_11825 [Bacteroidales bacterium]|nr:hypothetical protein [Bacteroidales bacterium]MDD3812420.1 hypothetical protein [Bacteroidales bacterium]NLO69074.1 hypothetical protein [Bacteroidales bacterium]
MLKKLTKQPQVAEGNGYSTMRNLNTWIRTRDPPDCWSGCTESAIKKPSPLGKASLFSWALLDSNQ